MTSFEESGAFAPVADVEAQDAIGPIETTSPFAAFGLAPELLAAVADLGYTQPTAVQQRAIPLALTLPDEEANDLMVSSETGSGKTAAYLLPVLHALLGLQRDEALARQAEWDAHVALTLAKGEPAPKKAKRHNPKNARHFKPATPAALVLAPTRELAQQVAHDAIALVTHCRGVRVATIVGGMPYRKQIEQLQNANLVVATPGRLLDLQRSGQIKLKAVRFLVVDEADRMLDLGFADALAEIHKLTAERWQTLMFSATFEAPIQKLALRVMPEGGAHVCRLQIDTPQQSQENIRQELYWADSTGHKRKLLDYWLRDPSIDQAIVFACTQIECEQLAQDLYDAGFAAASLHGGLSQALRNRRLKALRDGKLQILVATDVASRGIDVPTITHVINYGLPMKAEDYTHRIGRTGRAGRDGLAITLAEIRDRRRLSAIEAFTQKRFTVLVIDGLEPTRAFPPISAPRRPAGPSRRGAPDFGHRRNPRGGKPAFAGAAHPRGRAPSKKNATERGQRGRFRG
jgi:superfamily II DNA/RNA helicase